MKKTSAKKRSTEINEKLVCYATKNPDRQQQLLKGIEKLYGDAGLLVEFAADEEEACRTLKDATILLTWKFTPQMHAVANKLKWIHMSGAGVDHVMTDEMKNSDILITNSSGIHGRYMAEWTLAALLYIRQRWDHVEAWRRDRDWKTHKDFITIHRSLLRGSRALIVGIGAVGREIMDTLNSAGVQCAAIRRSARRSEYFQYPAKQLDSIIGDFDIVVIAAPLTTETRNLFNEALISRMKQGSILVNVARGEIVDETALINALRSGRFGYAAIDVFRHEPLPENSLLFGAPNLFMTPHVAGNYPNYTYDVIDLFLDNLKRYVTGQKLRNLVDKTLGY